VKNHFAKYLAYALSTLAVLAVFRLLGDSHSVGLYWSIAFFAVAGLDFYKSQVVEDGASEVPAYVCASNAPSGVYLDKWGFVRVDYFGSARQYPAANQAASASDPICSQPRRLGDNFVDRVVGYAVTAPFILPVRLYQAFKR